MNVIFEWAFHRNLPIELRASAVLQEASGIVDESNKTLHYDENLFNQIIEGVKTHQPSIDTIITECAPEWPLPQISKVDLTILRIAIYEILHRDETPTKVAIDEAVELGKEFGSVNSSKFVNGVLGTVVKKYQPSTEENK